MIRMQSLLTTLALAALGVTAQATPARLGNAIDYRLAYNARYESNIYHAYLDTQAVGAQLNVIEGRLDWIMQPSRQFAQTFGAYTDLALYTNYSNRNRTAFGVVYEPSYKYSRNGSLSLDVNFSRRNKDVLSDAGEQLARTLEKWEADLKVTHRYTFGRMRTEQILMFDKSNYQDSRDSNGVRLPSYNYRSVAGELNGRYRFHRNLHARFSWMLEQRDYAERRTYTIRYGAVRGRPFEIRQYTEHAGEFSLDGQPWPTVGLRAAVQYTRRTDNFENFYGFRQWGYKAVLNLTVVRNNDFQMSLEFRNRDYSNYHTSSIGATHRVAIDYATFELTDTYQGSSAFAVDAYVKNYNKVSNDPSFDYLDLTIGIGVSYRR